MPKHKAKKAVSGKKTVTSKEEHLADLFTKNNLGVKIDLGCGETKQPGWVGVDFRDVPGVDIVQDLTKFPWTNIPDESASVVMTSHLLEHINPSSSNPQLAGLIDLMLSKKMVSKAEIEAFVGEYQFLSGFIRFMDEVWRILKPGGQFISTFPYAASPGFWQDPTHVNGITHVTLAYFDPLAKEPSGQQYYGLYSIYRPKPWKILKCFYNPVAFMEVALEKRPIDKSYKTTTDNGLKA